MKKIIFSICILFFLFACNEAEKQKDEIKTTNDPIPFNPPKLEQGFLEKLYFTQMEIMKNPTSRIHKEKYIFRAYIADRNTLISFGNAKSTNPSTGEKNSPALIKRAAFLDAKRWATYGLLWLNNDFQPDFGKIKDTHKGITQELLTFNKGDSLVIVIASKVR